MSAPDRPATAASRVVERLCAELPADSVATDPGVVAAYARDHADACPAGTALAVVHARDTASVQTTLRVASATRTPVVTRGAGTGLSGGANAVEGGIVLSLAAMDAIIRLDVAGRIATVEPGVLNADLDAAAHAHGLRYAPDPASRDSSTIGGNIATNAGGACCMRDGVTGDHVAALVAVLADGSVVRTGGATLKNVAGLDLNRLLVGSEGTLAVVVQATVRLLPVRPAAGTLVAFFDDLADVGRAVVALRGSDALTTLEVMDATTIAAVESLRRMDLDTSAAAMLLASVEGVSAEVVRTVTEDAAARCTELGAGYVATTTDPEEGRMLSAARASCLPALERMGRWLLDDVAVPVPRVPDLLQACERIGTRTGVTVATFGHAGDGNLHPTIVYQPGEEDAALRAFDAILSAALELGGTITGEHGVGLLKRARLAEMVGERELALMRGIKAVFDPLGILNPGKGI